MCWPQVCMMSMWTCVCTIVWRPRSAEPLPPFQIPLVIIAELQLLIDIFVSEIKWILYSVFVLWSKLYMFTYYPFIHTVQSERLSGLLFYNFYIAQTGSQSLGFCRKCSTRASTRRCLSVFFSGRKCALAQEESRARLLNLYAFSYTPNGLIHSGSRTD